MSPTFTFSFFSVLQNTLEKRLTHIQTHAFAQRDYFCWSRPFLMNEKTLMMPTWIIYLEPRWLLTPTVSPLGLPHVFCRLIALFSWFKHPFLIIHHTGCVHHEFINSQNSKMLVSAWRTGFFLSYSSRSKDHCLKFWSLSLSCRCW